MGEATREKMKTKKKTAWGKPGLHATALRWLEREPLLYIDMLEALRRGIAGVGEAGPDGVLLYLDEDPYACEIAARTPAETARLAQLSVGAEMLVVHEEAHLPGVYASTPFTHMMTCRQCVYTNGALLPIRAPEVEFRTLDASWAPFVEAHYDNPVGIEYLCDQLDAGVVLGAFVSGEASHTPPGSLPPAPPPPNRPEGAVCRASAGWEIAGFVGAHAEGSLGMLEVLPAFRRRGIGAALQAKATNRQLQEGWTPFSQVEPGNTASLRLQRTLGFRITRRNIFWLEDVAVTEEYKRTGRTKLPKFLQNFNT